VFRKPCRERGEHLVLDRWDVTHQRPNPGRQEHEDAAPALASVTLVASRRQRSAAPVFVNVIRDQSRTSQAVNSVESGLRSVEPARADALELDFAAIRKRET
jgi:hypothetical protein